MSTQKKIEKITKKLRNFQPELILFTKILALKNFFNTNNINTCVVGLSGGLDSSFVLKLLLEVAKQPDSCLKQVHGVFLPIFSTGTTGQDKAYNYIHELNKSIDDKNYTFKNINLTTASIAYRGVLNFRNDWAIGQCDSIVRTPALYGYAANLQTMSLTSIVVGTTNKDEGEYLGFFGKASDAMVDLQPIRDLHKSELITLSKYLKIPKSIINRTPVGDVFNADTDENMIGAPYWFIEAYQILKDNNIPLSSITNNIMYEKYAMNIEIMHEKNKHKYKVGQPSHRVDVI